MIRNTFPTPNIITTTDRINQPTQSSITNRMQPTSTTPHSYEIAEQSCTIAINSYSQDKVSTIQSSPQRLISSRTTNSTTSKVHQISRKGTDTTASTGTTIRALSKEMEDHLLHLWDTELQNPHGFNWKKITKSMNSRFSKHFSKKAYKTYFQQLTNAEVSSDSDSDTPSYKKKSDRTYVRFTTKMEADFLQIISQNRHTTIFWDAVYSVFQVKYPNVKVTKKSLISRYENLSRKSQANQSIAQSRATEENIRLPHTSISAQNQHRLVLRSDSEISELEEQATAILATLSKNIHERTE